MSAHEEVGLSEADVLGAYRRMVLSRQVSERLWLLNRQGEVHFTITGEGSEAIFAAAAKVIRPGTDWLAVHYRDLTSLLALGDPDQMLGEIFLQHFGKGSHASGGRQMPMHAGNLERRILSRGSDVGSHVLHAVGIAHASKIKVAQGVTDGLEVAIAFFGDGASAQGNIHEALNWAGIHRLSVVFICVNNGWALSTPLFKNVAGGSIAARAAGYGMPGIVVDGCNFFAVYGAVKRAQQRAVRGEGPTLIEAICSRLSPHSAADDDAYRDPCGLAIEKTTRDPLIWLRLYLEQCRLLKGNPGDEGIAVWARELIDRAEEWARGQPEVTVTTAFEHVYI